MSRFARVQGTPFNENVVMRSVQEIPPDDEVLIAQVCRGDERAFRTLFSRYARYLAGVAYRMVGDDADLDDIVQETFIAAARGIHRLNDSTRLRVWLVTVAVRQAQRRLSQRRRRSALREELSAAPTETLTSDDEQVKEIFDALGRLSPQLRVPWLLHKVEGFTVSEVTAICRRSPATIKRRIKKADERLKRRLNIG